MPILDCHIEIRHQIFKTYQMITVVTYFYILADSNKCLTITRTRVGWSKHLALVWATLRAEVDVIGVQ